MGRTKAKSKKATSSKPNGTTAPAATVEALLLQSAHSIARCEFDAAKQVCQQACQLAVTNQDVQGCRDGFEILGTIELELNELDDARTHFLESIKHASTLPDPSPAPHLYLAQLSTPEESLTHFANALTILQAKLVAIEQSKQQAQNQNAEVVGDTQEEEEEEQELRRSASRALVGMTELYLTDLCFDPDAEANCEKHLSLAAQLDPTDPEVYQTLASVRLSQQRPIEAKDAAIKGWSLWRDLGPEDPAFPPASARLTLAKILIELELYESALEILNVLEQEDDEDQEMWYLSGWAWNLLGQQRSGPEQVSAPEDDQETAPECLSESKLCLENYMRLEELDPDQSDPEQLAHVKELLSRLEAAGVVASAGREEEGDEWLDDDEDDENEEAMDD
ncbi:hypothetical protein OIO90_000843 [Microbotryomycetes sp. JL221]|nr:hypothetical protein OIO90_000843 [Microbotryomycetes sp. JL221]